MTCLRIEGDEQTSAMTHKKTKVTAAASYGLGCIAAAAGAQRRPRITHQT